MSDIEDCIVDYYTLALFRFLRLRLTSVDGNKNDTYTLIGWILLENPTIEEVYNNYEMKKIADAELNLLTESLYPVHKPFIFGDLLDKISEMKL